jgi:hypothetical protein
MWIIPDFGFPLNLIITVIIAAILIGDWRQRYHKKRPQHNAVFSAPELSDDKRAALQRIVDMHKGYTVEAWKADTDDPEMINLLDNLPIGYRAEVRQETYLLYAYINGKKVGMITGAMDSPLPDLMNEHNQKVDVYFIGRSHGLDKIGLAIGCFAGFYKAPGVPPTGPNLVEWAENNIIW